MMTHRSQLGFTLAEAMISMAILGMIGTLVFGTFARAMDSRDRAEAITGRYGEIRQGMLRMSREIQMAFLSDHRDCDDPRTKTLFVAKSSSGGSRLDFTSFSHFKMHADANESDQNELGYFVDDDPDDSQKKAVFRREQARIDDEPDEGGIEQVLIGDVESLTFEFYDAKEDRWEEEWDTEDADFKGRLPMFVSIRLKAVGPDGKEEEFVTKTRVFLQKTLHLIGPGHARCVD